MSDRDFVAEMRGFVDEEAESPDPAAVVAARVVAKLRADDPGLLRGWLDLGAVGFVRDMVAHLDRSTRARVRANAGRSQFADAVGADDVTGFLDVRYVVDEAGTRMRLALMGRAALVYVASAYEADARAVRMEAAFIRALAKKVGAGTVGDVFSEEEVLLLRQSITGRRTNPTD